MRVQQAVFLIVVALAAGCSGPERSSASSANPAASAAAPTTAPIPPPVAGRVFVTNENGGDISVIDVATQKVVATIPVGKRPRGIRLSREGAQVFVALSGSPIAPPGVDESTLPPADKKADGIGIVSVKDLKLERIIRGGSDPEQLAVMVASMTEAAKIDARAN